MIRPKYPTRWRFSVASVLLLWSGCGGRTAPSNDTNLPQETDLDGDGFTYFQGDCDDEDALRNLGVTEVPHDGVDQDCDGSDAATQSIEALSRTIYTGDRPWMRLGQGVDCGEDADGDGVPDVIFSATEINSGDYARSTISFHKDQASGRIFVMSGGRLGTLELGPGDEFAHGPANGGQIGRQLLLLPDQDGDSLAELYTHDAAGSEDTLLRFDGLTRLALESADAAASMLSRDRLFSVGDLNDDGVDDLVAGSIYSSSPALIHWGLLTAASVPDEISAPADSRAVGYMAVGGDFDGDGSVDLVMGSQLNSFPDTSPVVGAYVLKGPFVSGQDRDLGQASTRIMVEDEAVQVSHLLAADTNDDGQSDLLLVDLHDGGPGVWRGRVFVFRGPLPPGDVPLANANATLTGETVDEQFGYASAHGDYNGDGVPDLFVSAPGKSLKPGRVYVFLGPIADGMHAAVDADLVLRGDGLGDWAGASIAACDLDGDGAVELVIGAEFGGEDRQGRVYIVGGGSGL